MDIIASAAPISHSAGPTGQTRRRISPGRSFLRPSEFLLLAVCLTILGAQLFLQPRIGLADNGDFSKVLGRVGLKKAGEGNFQFFVSSYSRAQTWDTVVWYSEVVPAWLAVHLQAIIRRDARFDIAYLAAIHVALFLALYWVLLLLLRPFPPAPRFALALLGLWIFTDVFYVAYFNSFYSDTAALLGLLAMVLAALHLLRRSHSPIAWWGVYALAAVFFVTSKPQHAIWAAFPAAFATARSWQAAGVRRIAGALLAASLVGLGVFELGTLPEAMKAMPLFDVVFLKLTADPARRADVLHDLGMPQSYGRYAGVSSWTPGTPMLDPSLRQQFYVQARGHLPWFYLSHPRVVARVLQDDLHASAPSLRPPMLANYRREDGFAAYSHARRFCLWSDLRVLAFRAWPEHIVLWYAFVMAGALLFLKNGRPGTRGSAALCLALAMMGIGEFCFASLADAAQTDRHLFLFHTLTDVTIYFVAVAAAQAPFLCGGNCRWGVEGVSATWCRFDRKCCWRRESIFGS
jgi:hypothetical protein